MNKKTEISSLYKQRIAEAADALFCENGIEKTTMDMISRQVGYSKATVYSYYASKDEVLFSIVLERMKKIKEDISAVVAKKCGTYAKFFEICNIYAAFQKKNPIYFDAMTSYINMDVSNDATPAVFKEIYKLGIDTNALVADVILQGINDGLIAKDTDTDSAILYAWGCISGLIRMASQKEDYIRMSGVTPEEFLNYSFEKLISGFVKR